MGCDITNRYLTHFDFYHPELDDLGMQPAYNVFFSDVKLGGSFNADNITGWQYRYSELKTKYDVVNEGLWNTSRRNWVGYKQSLYGTFRARDTAEGNASPTLFDLFYIAPQYTNTRDESDDLKLMYQYQAGTGEPKPPTGWRAQMTDPSDGTTKLDIFGAQYVYEKDNFLINQFIHCYKTSIMSLHSLPNFKF